MRITTFHLFALDTATTSQAQQKVATASEVASSGVQVALPSDNVAAWVAAAQDRIQQAISTGAGNAIQSGLDQLQQTDGALQTIATVVSSAQDLAVQGTSGTLNAGDLQNLATEAKGLFQTALTAANAQSADGTYLLGGSANQTQPFDANGNYQGNADVDTIGTGSGQSAAVTMSGESLTAANGVDVLPALQQLATALASNNTAGIQASLTTLNAAVGQVANMRAQGGAAQAVLDSASTAAQQLQTQLTGDAAQLVQADAVTAASNLAQATQALDVAQAVSANVMSSLAPSNG
jgi:flagellar hook-associated protein 3 FlgL